jgi:hypothetical protein
MDAFLAVLAVLASTLSPPPTGAGPERDPTPPAVRVLHDWDARRALAWSSGRPAALRPLYVAGSRAGRADRAALAAYAGRGLRVRGLRMQVASVEVLERSPTRLVLAVTDRLVTAVAVGDGERWPLPADRWSTRVVALRRSGGPVGAGWRVEEVCAAAQTPAAASTAPTSRCRKR